ncbi:TPA: protein KlaA [Escherichia coli]|uniref:toxic anion resistance protein n=1 Tax=Escherichia TaxID=561 RepID=UPI000CF7808A|nr:MULTISPECIES: toxic anion resistance protein [unclassified Escherichia]EES2026007.1 protein KlaA [Escherichia coli]EFB2841241.1 protein KlaA [Escherichia coli]EIY6704791.1 toxic anion resistance protein [Escherichia coli]MBB2342288.1 toxic anion resistance protein [Escherichia sp. 93.0750]MCF7291744.1 toxic anion resistance protein [Escherichia coli]
MKDTHNITVPSVDELKSTVLPGLIMDARAISHYGDSAVSSGAMDRYSSLMEKNAVTELSGTLSGIVSALVQADPQRIESNPSWLSRFTGKHLETQVRYQLARHKVEHLIDQGEFFLAHVNETLQALDDLLAIYQLEIRHLNIFIQAGREYLKDSFVDAMPEETRIAFDNPRERLARKIANLATLLSSHEMTEMQLKMTQAQCIDMMDRFDETTKVLVPVWRQHTLSLNTAKNIDPSIVKQATSAHEALLSSLHKSLEGIAK